MTDPPVVITTATVADGPAITMLLTASALPSAGLDAHLAATVVARVEGTVVGCAALELHGSDALLRSVVVAASRRGTGLGRRLTEAALALGGARGVKRYYLLTETAERFFPRFGFHPIPRADVPDSVKTSVEFRGACPETAIVMALRGS
ncbi:MAG TPA: arsenic resistance N-acetyltransferase ArsN2 [Gemmatimonadales bacterium]